MPARIAITPLAYANQRHGTSRPPPSRTCPTPATRNAIAASTADRCDGDGPQAHHQEPVEDGEHPDDEQNRPTAPPEPIAVRRAPPSSGGSGAGAGWCGAVGSGVVGGSGWHGRRGGHGVLLWPTDLMAVPECHDP